MSFIAYHGTTIENARSILRDGFRRDVWFARSIVDARTFGGPVVLAVRFALPEPNPDEGQERWWQFHTNDLCVPASWIVRDASVLPSGVQWSKLRAEATPKGGDA
jgi:hypothetical protein